MRYKYTKRAFYYFKYHLNRIYLIGRWNLERSKMHFKIHLTIQKYFFVLKLKERIYNFY